MKASLATLVFFAFTSFLFSCQISVKTDDGNSVPTGNTKIRNGIELNASGLKVEQAYLTFDDNSLVPEDNKTTTNKNVKLHLMISGWKQENEMVFPGASEKIQTSNGDIFLDEPDLFNTYDPTGVKPDDAKYITLSAVIKSVDKLYDYFLVSFRIWDKKGTGEIKGSYKLYL